MRYVIYKNWSIYNSFMLVLILEFVHTLWCRADMPLVKRYRTFIRLLTDGFYSKCFLTNIFYQIETRIKKILLNISKMWHLRIYAKWKITHSCIWEPKNINMKLIYFSREHDCMQHLFLLRIIPFFVIHISPFDLLM